MKSLPAPAAHALPAALLGFALAVAAAAPARAETSVWADDDLAREASPCALGRTDRQQASARSCLSCHDGTTGTAASYTTPQDAAPRLSAMHGAHPIEVVYAVARARNPSQLHPQELLPRGLVLPGGKVTCVTCHDGASREPHRAAVSLSRSRLCMSCHDL